MENYQMLRSIQGTPDYLKECFREDIRRQIALAAKELRERKIRRLIFTGCGTSLMIAHQAQRLFYVLAGAEGYVVEAFEQLHYPTMDLGPSDALVAYSHTGGTKAVCDLCKAGRRQGVFTIGMTEVTNSRLHQSCDVCIVGPGGKDEATPKTRSYSTGLMISAMLACTWKGDGAHGAMEKLSLLPQRCAQVLVQSQEAMKSIAEQWNTIDRFVLVGSGSNVITAQEGALKLLEAANVCALSTTVEELAHGNELYLDEHHAVIFLIPENCMIKERLSMVIQGTRCTGAKVYGICGDEKLSSHFGEGERLCLSMPVDEHLSMFLMILPLQYFAYYSTIVRGKNPDLASAVREEMQEAIRLFHPPGYH